MDKKQEEKKVVECQLCHQKILKSASMTAEGKDYVWHFCKECFATWKNSDKK